MSGLQENENSSFDFEYWYMEQQGQPFPLPVERHYQQDLEHLLTSDPAFI